MLLLDKRLSEFPRARVVYRICKGPLPFLADMDSNSLERRFVLPLKEVPIFICKSGAVGLWLSANAISAQFFGKYFSR